MLEKIQRIDDKVCEGVTRLHRPVLTRFLIIMTYLGSGGLIWWLTLCIPFLLTKKYRAVGIIIFFSMGFTFVVGEIIIKRIVARVRPSELLEREEMMIKPPKDHSFPSGHTACSFTVATVVFLTCPAMIWIPVLIGAMIISFSRIYLRVHYLSDVIAGTLLGLSSGALCYLLFKLFVFQYVFSLSGPWDK